MVSRAFDRIGRPRHPDVLTATEWEVLAGVRDGQSNREIAAARDCSIETIRFHLKNIRRKLGVQSRDQLRAFPGRPAERIARARDVAKGHRIREQIPLVHTRDMGRALEFYVGALQFEVVSCWPDDEELPRWAALAAGGARVMLRTAHPRRPLKHTGKPGLVSLNLYVDGLDGFRRHLIDAGFRCDEPEALFYGAREFDLLDPDGNEITIVEFAASEPRYTTTAAAQSGPKRSSKRPKPKNAKRSTR